MCTQSPFKATIHVLALRFRLGGRPVTHSSELAWLELNVGLNPCSLFLTFCFCLIFCRFLSLDPEHLEYSGALATQAAVDQMPTPWVWGQPGLGPQRPSLSCSGCFLSAICLSAPRAYEPLSFPHAALFDPGPMHLTSQRPIVEIHIVFLVNQKGSTRFRAPKDICL